MTIHETLKTKLVDHGLFADEAEAVLTELAAAPESESMQGRWREDADDYPPVMTSVLMLSAKRKAVEWIDRNKPMHWARALLA